ncbi:hypothetical protein Tco_1229797 [Tanacetum coccineum]
MASTATPPPPPSSHRHIVISIGPVIINVPAFIAAAPLNVVWTSPTGPVIINVPAPITLAPPNVVWTGQTGQDALVEVEDASVKEA